MRCHDDRATHSLSNRRPGEKKMSEESKHGDQEPQDDISGLMWTVGVLLAVSMIAAYFISF